MPIPFAIQRKYAAFYIEGRESSKLRCDVDEEDLAARVLDGKISVHDACVAAAENAAKPLEVDRRKRTWLADNEDAIKDANDCASDGKMEPKWGDEAYSHYLHGKIDELAMMLESDVVEAMSHDLFDDDNEEGEEDGDSEAEDENEDSEDDEDDE